MSRYKKALLWSNVSLNSGDDTKDNNPTFTSFVIFVSAASCPSSCVPFFVSSSVLPEPSPYIPFILSFSFYTSFCSSLLFCPLPTCLFLLLFIIILFSSFVLFSSCFIFWFFLLSFPFYRSHHIFCLCFHSHILSMCSSALLVPPLLSFPMLIGIFRFFMSVSTHTVVFSGCGNYVPSRQAAKAHGSLYRPSLTGSSALDRCGS